MGIQRTTERPSILVIEPNASGHHGPYLEWMAHGLSSQGCDLTIATLPDSATHPSFRTLERTDPHMKVIPIPAAPADGQRLTGLAAREFYYWSYFRKCFRALHSTARPDVVFLPYLDYCLYAFGLLGSPFGECPWVGLAMRPSFHYREMQVIAPKPSLAYLKKRLFFRLLRNTTLRQLLTIDEPLVKYLEQFPGNRKVTFFPEPVGWSQLPEKNDARSQLGLSPTRHLILVYGAITERKGVLELLHAMLQPTFPHSVDVVLAGRQSPEIHRILDRPDLASLMKQGRVLSVDRFIEAAEEPLFFAATDLVWLGYQEHYNSSGVLGQAVAASRRVLSCRQGVIGWQSERHGLGAVIDPSDPESINAAVHEMLEIIPPGIREVTTLHPPSFSKACALLKETLLPNVLSRT